MSPLRESFYITAYLRRSLPFMRGWEPKATVAWVQWFMRHGRALTAYSNGKMTGVALVRLVDAPGQAEVLYADTGGRVAYIEAVACKEGMLPALFKHFRFVFPMSDTMVWVRSKFNNRPCVITMQKAVSRFS